MQEVATFISKFVSWELAIRVILAGFAWALTFFLRRILDTKIIDRIAKWAKKTKFVYDDQLIEALRRPLSSLVLLTGIFVGIMIIEPGRYLDGSRVDMFLLQSFKVATSLIVVWTFTRLSDLLANMISDRIGDRDELLRKQFMPLIRRSIQVAVVSIGVLVIIQNLGYSVTSLIAGLGIGGLAVALAAQETLANLFSSFTVLTDMPFRVGDWIVVDKVEGIIETIGFRATRIRTFGKSLVIVPNKIFMNSPIENFTMRDRRRIYLNLGITYDTSPENIESFLKGIRCLVNDHPEIHKDFYLVNFNEYKDFSLNIMVYCFTTTTVWNQFLRIQEELNLSIFRLARELGVSFAFPSQTIYWGPGQSPTSHSLR